MSQSPETEARRGRYEDGWEAINRMIREDGSWSGRERNCLLLGGDDGTFADASAAAGVDFIDDGRAFAVLDFDADGDPDFLLRNRNGPRLRVLENVFQTGNRSVWFHLTGVTGNKDAIGARIEIETGRGRRLKAVEAGSGFLSQHTRWVWFGLGNEESVARARIRWPGGRVQELARLPAGRRYRVVEGEDPAPEEFRAAPPAAARPRAREPAGREAPERDPPQDSPLAQVWLADPLPAPDFRLPALDGRTLTLSAHRGNPLILLFLSPDCGACVAEVDGLRTGADPILALGGKLLGIALGDPGRAGNARERYGDAPFPVLLADPRTAATWNALHRSLFNRYRDLAVPTAFLLGREGRIEKVYRGRTPAGDFAADLKRLSLPRERRLLDPFPFPGRLLGSGFRRDVFLLGAALTEAGAVEAAAEALEGALAENDTDVEALYNLGIARGATGDAEGAARAYRKALALRPDMVDALNNLGVLEADAGRLAEARETFGKALAAQPGHGEAVLNLGRVCLKEGRPEAAVLLYRSALERDPESVPLWQALGFAHYRIGEIEGGIAAYRRAHSLAPADPDAAGGLANLLLQSGNSGDQPEAMRIAGEAVRLHPRNVGLLNAWGLALAAQQDFRGAETAYLRAIEADPRSASPYLNLARLRLEAGDRAGASKPLRDLLEVHPGHPEAIRSLSSLTDRMSD